MANIIDTHIHLEEIENLEEVLQRALQNNIVGLITVGSDYLSNRKNLELSKKIKSPKIYIALGIHPMNINLDELETTAKFIEENIEECIAIGEAGLDYWARGIRKNCNEKDKQRKILELQLDIAKRYCKPVIIHSRGAWQECYEMVKNKGIEKAVFHWYSGPIEVLTKILCDGYFISATPALEYSIPHRLAIEYTPIENIIVETDSPVRYKTASGETYISEPKDVLRTLYLLSIIKKIPIDDVINVTTQNAKRIFNI
jgi:TatD DNase family protein